MKTYSVLLSACAISAILPSGGVFAQDASPQAAEPVSSGEIIVTARRREESLQDVPIAVTALSGEALQQQGVRSVADLNVPSLKITSAASLRNVAVIAIRGQRTQESQLLTDPAVGTYFAEVVQPRPYGFGQSLYDLQSVQVLKGVQGTLFGRNVTGGAVLVEPNHPKDVLEGEVRGSIGNFDLREIYGMLNVPLGDKAAFRIAGKKRERDGFSRDVSNGRDYDDQNFKTFRASLLLKPTEDLESLFILDYFKAHEHGTAAFMTALKNNPATDTTPLAQQERLRQQGLPLTNFSAQLAQARALFAAKRYRLDIASGDGGNLDVTGLPYERNRNLGIQNKTTFDLGSATIKNIAGYREVSRSNVQDYDGVPGFILSPFQTVHAKNYSEELQVQGKALGDKLNYTVGGFYFLEKGSELSEGVSLPELMILGGRGPAGLLTTPASLFSGYNPSDARAETYAFYGAASYAFTPALTLSGGLRYNNDKRSVHVAPTRPNLNQCAFDPDNNPATPAPPVAQCSFSNREGWDAFTWDATLQYEPNENLTAYASTRKGFRAGGFSLRAQSEAALRPFNPETVQEYELGLKNRFDVGAGYLNTTAALFYQLGKNVQKQNPLGIDTNGDGQADTVVTVITNSAKQENYGLELEASLALNNGLKLGAYYSYVDVNVLRGAIAGEFQMRGIPHHQAGANIAYSLPIPDQMGQLTFSANVSYQSRVPLDDRDVEGIEKGYALAKARLNWDNIGGSGIGAALFMDNIFNKLYRVGALGLMSEIGFLSSVYGEPRTYGLEIGYKF